MIRLLLLFPNLEVPRLEIVFCAKVGEIVLPGPTTH